MNLNNEIMEDESEEDIFCQCHSPMFEIDVLTQNTVCFFCGKLYKDDELE